MFRRFKNETEGKIIKLALDAKDTNGKLDWLIQEFADFKDTVYTHMDGTVNAIESLQQEQALTNHTLKEWESKIEKIGVIEADVAELKVKLSSIEHKVEAIARIEEKVEALEHKVEAIPRIEEKLDAIGKRLP